MRKRKTSGKTKFSIINYLDPTTLSEEDREIVQLLLKVPRYFKRDLKQFAKEHYFSMTDCIQDSYWKLRTGWNAIEAAEKTLNEQIREETKTHYQALINTINSFKDELEKAMGPLRLASEDITKFKETIQESTAREIQEMMQKRMQSTKLKIMQWLHFENLPINDLIARAASFSGLPEIQLYEAVQTMVDENLIVIDQNRLCTIAP